MSASSTTSSPEVSKYRVFISHAEEDKATIAIPLRGKLLSHRVATFVDETDLRVGDETPDATNSAMEAAEIAILVLSPEFVAEKQTMKELLHFLKARKEKHDAQPSIPVVIPFYYRLTPSELLQEPRIDRLDRNGKSLYHRTRFLERMNNREPEANFEGIKAALQEVCKIRGVSNYVDAANNSSYEMSVRRGILLKVICQDVLELLQGRSVNRDTTTMDTSRSEELDAFCPHFEEMNHTAELVFDFEKRDENGTKLTQEGRLLDLIVDEATDVNRAIVIHGIGGVGKTSLVEGLLGLEEVKTRFRDGVYYTSLGIHATQDDVIRSIIRFMWKSGGRRKAYALRNEKDLREVVSCFRSWFAMKQCLFMVDDIWETKKQPDDLMSVLLALHDGGRDSKVLVTTCGISMASLKGTHFRLEPLEPLGYQARTILVGYSGIPLDTENTTQSSAVTRVLKRCCGLPRLLEHFGRDIRMISCQIGPKIELAYEVYASRLDVDLQVFANSHQRLHVTSALSPESLDNKMNDMEFDASLTSTETSGDILAMITPTAPITRESEPYKDVDTIRKDPKPQFDSEITGLSFSERKMTARSGVSIDALGISQEELQTFKDITTVKSSRRHEPISGATPAQQRVDSTDSNFHTPEQSSEHEETGRPSRSGAVTAGIFGAGAATAAVLSREDDRHDFDMPGGTALGIVQRLQESYENRDLRDGKEVSYGFDKREGPADVEEEVFEDRENEVEEEQVEEEEEEDRSEEGTLFYQATRAGATTVAAATSSSNFENKNNRETEELIRIMVLYREDVSICTNAVSALSTVIRSAGSFAEKGLLNAKAFREVLVTMQRHSDNPLFIRKSLDFIDALANFVHMQDEIVETGGIPFAADIIAQNSNDSLLLESACSIVERLCRGRQKHQDMFGHSNGVQSLITLLQSQQGLPDVAERALMATASVCSNNPDNQHEAMKAGAPKALTSVLNAYRGLNASVVASAASAMTALVTPENPPAAQEFSETKALDYVVRAMKKHPDSVAVQENGSTAIAAFCESDPHIISALLQSGISNILMVALQCFLHKQSAVVQIARAMRAITNEANPEGSYCFKKKLLAGTSNESSLPKIFHTALSYHKKSLPDSAIVIVSICATINRLCMRSVTFKNEVGNSCIVEELKRLVERTAEYPEIGTLQPVLATICTLVLDSDENKNRFQEIGGVEAILDVMQKYGSDPYIVEHCCAALRYSCNDHDGNCNEVKSHNGVCKITSVLTRHSQNVNVMMWGCLALAELCKGDENVQSSKEVIDGIDRVIISMTTFADNHRFLAGACEFLGAASLDHGQNQERIVRLGGRTAIVKALEAHPGDSTLKEAGSSALIQIQDVVDTRISTDRRGRRLSFLRRFGR